MKKLKNNHLQINDIKEKFKERNFELLEDTYINNRIKMRYKCLKCNILDTTSYHNFNQLSGCKNCKKMKIEMEKRKILLEKPKKEKRKITYDIVKQEFEENGCVLLSKEYLNNSTLLEYICHCGETASKSYNCFQYKKGCMSCTGTPKYTIEQVKRFFEDKNCELLDEEYKSVMTQMNYICSCGNISTISLSNLLRGHRCRLCRTYNRKYDTDSIIEELTKIGYTLISEKYHDYDSRLFMKCGSGHDFNTTWRFFLKGTRCKLCKDNESCNEINKIEETDVPKDIQENSCSKSETSCDFLDFAKSKLDNNGLELFANSFWLYLKYNQESDFVVDFDTVWKWIEYSRRDNARRLLTRHFVENTDYKIEKLTPPIGGKVPVIGRPKETILITVSCFKRFCMRADTKKATQIHDYYINLETLNFEYINAKNKENEEIVRHNTLLQGHQRGLYIASTGLFSEDNLEIIEFGKTDDLAQRAKQKSRFPKWLLKFFCKSENPVQLERNFKANKEISSKRLKMNDYGTELLKISEEFTPQKCYDIALKLSRSLKNNELEIEIQKTEQLRLQIELEKLKRES